MAMFNSLYMFIYKWTPCFVVNPAIDSKCALWGTREPLPWHPPRPPSPVMTVMPPRPTIWMAGIVLPSYGIKFWPWHIWLRKNALCISVFSYLVSSWLYQPLLCNIMTFSVNRLDDWLVISADPSIFAGSSIQIALQRYTAALALWTSRICVPVYNI